MERILKAAASAAAVVAAGWLAVSPAEAKSVRVLAVGNSFAANAARDLTNLVAATSNRLTIEVAYIGGCDFERHMRHADAHEADPNSPTGRPYAGRSLKDLLLLEPWDIVTLQQASPRSFKPETYHPHADRLMAYIRRYAPKAEIVVHQTWAYRDDHPFWGMTNFGTDAMYAGLRKAYDDLAATNGLRLIPCGDAFQAARLDPAWGRFSPDPAFDPKAAVHPALPSEKRSLHQGFAWWKGGKAGAWKLGFDGYHANRSGQYLLGCVWYEFLFGESVVGNRFVPDGMAAADAAILQRIAHGVVTEKRRPAVGP